MKMWVYHTGRTGKETSILFDTDRKSFRFGDLGFPKHDASVYVDRVKDITYLKWDLLACGFKEEEK